MDEGVRAGTNVETLGETYVQHFNVRVSVTAGNCFTNISDGAACCSCHGS